VPQAHLQALGKKFEEELLKVEVAIQGHVATHPGGMVDLVGAFLQLSPEQQAHVGEMHQLGCSGRSLNLTTGNF
jgi:hypothetical protein